MSKYKLYDFKEEEKISSITKDITSMINKHFSNSKIIEIFSMSYPDVKNQKILKIIEKLRIKLRIRENLLDDYIIEETGAYWVLTKGKSKIYKLNPNVEISFEKIEVTRQFFKDFMDKIDQLDQRYLNKLESLLGNFMKIDTHNYHG